MHHELQRLTRRLLPLLLLAPAGLAQEADPGAAPAAAAVAAVDRAATAPTASAPTDAAMMLRLRSGGILWGSIAEHDEEALRFHRLDNGGTVRLRWSLLDPDQEEQLRLRFGYVEGAVEELMVEADRIYLQDGSERVGLITNRTEGEVWLKTANGLLKIPKLRISGPSSTVQVPALDIYSKDELYQQKLFELQSQLLQEGTAAAEAHFEVAEFCEQLFNYIQALVHYEAAVRMDPEYQAEVMPTVLARTREKAELQVQVDHLQEADLWRARRHYDKAETLLQSFPELYPDSPLMEDYSKLVRRLEKYQLRDLKVKVVQRWHYWMRRFAQTAARKMSYEEVLAYVDGPMSEEIAAKVHEDLTEIAPQIQADEVRSLWEAREGGRYRQASYGHGTWLLGEGRARADIDQPASESDQPAAGSQGEARQKLEDRIQRYMRNQEIANRANAGGAGEEEDPNAFWERWPSGNKTQWILAYYAENSGDFQPRARFRNCRECGGTGTRLVVFTGGAVSGAESGERLVPCPTCHYIAVVRLIRYR